MPVNAASVDYTREVGRIHGAVVDFGKLVKAIQDNIGTDYQLLTTIPARVTALLAQKAAFDALNIPSSFLNKALENNLGYEDFQLNDAADFNAVFTEAPAFRTFVENNINQLPPSYVNNQLSFVTASAPVQTAIAERCAGILEHYVNL